MHLIARSYPAGRATEARVLQLDRDFEFSYQYYFEDTAIGGPRMHLWDSDDTGQLYGDRLQPGSWGPHLGSAVRPYDGGPNRFALFGESTTVDSGAFTPNESHTVRVVRDGDTITGYHDDQELVSASASAVSVDLSKPYKLLITSGTRSGEETPMWLDEFRFVHR